METIKTIVITGASEGLGEAIATALKAKNHKIWLLARTPQKLESVNEKLIKDGFTCEVLVCNINDDSQITEAINKIIEVDKKIDVLINNAAIWFEEDIESASMSEIKKVFDTNVFGLMFITAKVAAEMKTKRYGTILNVISTSAIDAESEWPVYVSSKFAVKGFSQSIKKKYAEFNIRILDIYPAGINTNFYKNAGIPIEPTQDWMMDKNKIAEIVRFLVEFSNDISIDNIEIRKN